LGEPEEHWRGQERTDRLEQAEIESESFKEQVASVQKINSNNSQLQSVSSRLQQQVKELQTQKHKGKAQSGMRAPRDSRDSGGLSGETLVATLLPRVVHARYG
jgi:hypothetical protein